MVVKCPRTVLFIVIAVVFWNWWFTPLVNYVVPHGWWLDVRGVEIEDSPDGSSPAVIVDRDINADYIGNVEITIRQVVGGPDDVPAECTRGRYNIPYKKDFPYPDPPPTLEWFQGVPPNVACQVVEGAWRADFTWSRRFLGLPLYFTVKSNIFIVGPLAAVSSEGK